MQVRTFHVSQRKYMIWEKLFRLRRLTSSQSINDFLSDPPKIVISFFLKETDFILIASSQIVVFFLYKFLIFFPKEVFFSAIITHTLSIIPEIQTKLETRSLPIFFF